VTKDATNELPPGYMWFIRRAWPIWAVEQSCQESMAFFDHYGPLHSDHWRNDPSYDWAAQTKRKREGKLMKYRPQTATLDEAMGRVVELPDRAALAAITRITSAPLATPTDPADEPRD
jgi:hypothetical protein